MSKIDEFFEFSKPDGSVLYDLAIMDKDGCDAWKYPMANTCNNSHSVTKFFYAAAAGILAGEGKIKLTDRVTDILDKKDLPKKYDKSWDKVTVADLLMHKTGIDKPACDVDDDEASTVIGGDFLKYVLRIPITGVTGTDYRYTDAAYYLVSRVISAASGMNAEQYLNEKIYRPLKFREHAQSCCPMGYPIGGSGLYMRSDDAVKLAYVYACDGKWKGRRLLPAGWVDSCIENDYACTRYSDSDIYLKTGAHDQIVAFSRDRGAAIAWHGYCVADQGARNDRMLYAFRLWLDSREERVPAAVPDTDNK